VLHKSHFCILPSLPKRGTPNGQAIEQLWHPMHSWASIRTTRVAASREIAPVGQTAPQGASSQCMQAMET